MTQPSLFPIFLFRHPFYIVHKNITHSCALVIDILSVTSPWSCLSYSRVPTIVCRIKDLEGTILTFRTAIATRQIPGRRPRKEVCEGKTAWKLFDGGRAPHRQTHRYLWNYRCCFSPRWVRVFKTSCFMDRSRSTHDIHFESGRRRIPSMQYRSGACIREAISMRRIHVLQ